jgi:hypothetical protein
MELILTTKPDKPFTEPYYSLLHTHSLSLSRTGTCHMCLGEPSFMSRVERFGELVHHIAMQQLLLRHPYCNQSRTFPSLRTTYEENSFVFHLLTLNSK